MRSLGATSLGVAGMILLVGCGKGGRAESASAAVEIASPAEGDTVSVPFTIRLTARGAEVVPATGVREAGRGHHHLLIDTDLPASGAAVPTGAGFIHLGTGASERVIDSLAPGPHRLIAVLGFGDHVPMPDAKPDTVDVVVR